MFTKDLNQYQNLIKLVKEEFGDEEHTLEYIISVLPFPNKLVLTNFLKWLIDFEIIIKQENGKYFWSRKK